MPLPAVVAQFNRRVTNPLARRFAGRLPPFGLIVDRGRASGRQHRTPVMAFPFVGGVAIALTYGPGVDWVRNLLAAGGGLLIYGGREIPLRQPRLVGEAEGRPHLPALVRRVLRLIRVTDYLLLSRDSA